MTLRVLIGSDVCPIGRNLPIFEQGEASLIFNDLLHEFERADISIINLECPLILEETPIAKCGPVLGVPATCVNGLKSVGIDVVNLANNHIMDHGPRGLETTIQALQDNGIAHFGAGKDLTEARRLYTRDINGARIGILGLAEHEFGIAGESKPGANPLDVMSFVRNIHQYRLEADYLIVVVHGSAEHHLYPRPAMVDTCRFLVEQGANAVVCQHTHCAGCMEMYCGAPIIYGQGNLIFDMPCVSPTWNEGVLVLLTIGGGGRIEVELIPYLQSDVQSGARRMPLSRERSFLNEFRERSRLMLDGDFLMARWEDFCSDHKRHYLSMLHWKPSLVRRALGRLNMLHLLDSREGQRVRLHLFRCESLREALITVLLMESRE